MRVIGGNDYWDSAAAYGVDRTITLVRNTNKDAYNFETNNFFFPHISYKSKENKDRKLNIGVIFVAGKAYPFSYDESNTMMYSLEEVVAAHPNIKKKWFSGYSDYSDYEYFETQPAFTEKKVTDFLMQHNASIALIFPIKSSYGGWRWRESGDGPKHEKSKVWINPSFLKDYQFYKIKDSFTMFMEVSNWVGGVLPTSQPTVELTDKSKIVKAGFDLKTSFRKESPDK